MRGKGSWLGWLVLVAGLSGSYFALRALAYLVWFQDFVLVAVLLGLVGVVLGVTVYGFLLFRGLGGSGFLAIAGIGCIVVGVGGWFTGDIAFLIVFIVAGALLSGTSVIDSNRASRFLPGVSRILVILGLVMVLLYVLSIVLPVVGSVFSGWGMKPVFDADKIYAPVFLGYRVLSVGEAVRSIVINGSYVLLQLFDNSIVRGVVEKVSNWVIWVATSLGSLIVDLKDFSGRIDVIRAPTPTTISAPSGPPGTVLSFLEVSSSINSIFSTPLLIIVNVAYGLILVAVGLLYMGREV